MGSAGCELDLSAIRGPVQRQPQSGFAGPDVSALLAAEPPEEREQGARASVVLPERACVPQVLPP